MLDTPEDAKSLDTLSTPLGADLRARHAPDLLRIRFEKCAVQLFSEPIDEELLQGVFPSFWEHCTFQIANSDFDGAPQAQVQQRVLGERDRIVEKAPQVINPRLTRAQ